MNRIRKLREGANVEQTDLYCRLKWKQSRLTDHEHDARTPELDEARRIVHALNALGTTCSTADVFPEPETDAERLAS